ncbi:MAG: hypothetical protein IT374_26425 [Polyangiaceae bacterium]|nr:hypothetical protein [Polyangiaceae bacterium]
MLDSLDPLEELDRLEKRLAKYLPDAPTPSRSTDRARYRNDPVGYFRDVLRIEPWSRQRDLLTAVAQHPRNAVRSGHKVSKSNSCAGIAYWWADTRSRGGVVLTAPTGRQVEEILWREVRAMYARCPPDTFDAAPAKLPSTGLRFPDGRFIIGFATDEAERLQGFSGDELLFIVDEASGVDEAIFEAIEGNRAGGARVLLTGNPTQTSGTFFDAFGARAEFWNRVHISSEESPNVTGEASVPGLATAEWIAEKRAEWGEDSPLYQVRVRGNFPEQSENAIIGLGLVQAATARHATTPDEGPLSIGVDPARFGDDETGIAPVRGKRAHAIRTLRSMDTVDVAGQVLATCSELARDGETIRVQVDEIGIGAGVLDTLRRRDSVKLAKGGGTARLVAVGVNAAESAPTSDLYHRMRDQVWFATRDWLRDGGAIPDDGRLHGELVAPLYAFDTSGRYVVEPKAKTKARLGRSPDRADALGLAVFRAPVVTSGYRNRVIDDL